MAVKKEKKEKQPKAPTTSPPYQIVDWLTCNKKQWNELSPADQKGFSPFMINRWLSMDLNLTGFINDLQEFTAGMDKERVWKLYLSALPEVKFSLKYIKSEKKVEDRDIQIFKKYFSTKEEYAIDYFQTLSATNEGKQKIEQIRRNYSYEKF